ncbi:MAG: SPASM domain-containing protein [Desulfovibrionaceae bacterium]
MRLGDLLPRPYPTLDWLQVEVSTHTTDSGGTHGLHAAHRDRWITAHFSMELFHALLPAIQRVAMVHLQGWGEPFLHPQLVDMVALAKRAECRVTTATSGEALQEPVLDALARIGLDSITFSLAALDEKRNLERKGASMHAMFRALDILRRVKERLNVDRPKANVLYTLHRSGVDLDYDPKGSPLDRDELARLPAALEGLGVSTIIISPVAFTARREQQQETLVPANEAEYQRAKRRLDLAVRETRDKGMAMHYFLMHGGREDMRCIENVRGAAFVDVAGNVAPCVFSALPVDGPASCWFMGREHPLPRLTFGNVADRPFKAIWRDPDYARFRRASTRDGHPPHCGSCWRPYMAPA